MLCYFEFEFYVVDYGFLRRFDILYCILRFRKVDSL